MPAAMPAVRRKGWRAATVAGGVLAFAWMAGSPAVAGGSTVPSAASAMVGAPAMALTGVTLGPGGRVLSGVEIRVSSLVPGGSFLPQRVRSDARGHFSVGNLPPGEYRVIALKGGYAVLIGQINTLVQDTLELILRPAGDPGPPGTRPADGSWTLRLPRRDVLEDLEDGAAGDASAGPPVAPRLAGAPLMFEMRVSNTEGPSEDSRPVPGVEAFLSGSGALGRVGLVSGSLRHRGDSRSAAFNDVADQARLGWVSPPSKGSRLAADLEFLRQLRGLEDEEPAPGSWPELDSELEAWRLSLRELRPVSPGAPAFAVELDLVRGFQDGTDPAAAPGNFLARRANASLTTARRWHRHDLTVAGSVRSAGGAFLEQDEPADVVSAAVPRGLRALGSADGTAFQLGVTDRVSVASGLELTGRAVADATATGVYRGTRAAAVIGAQWTTPSGLRVRADAGMTAGRRSRGLLGLSADGSVGPVEWSAGYAREAGPVEDRASLLQGPGLVTDYEGIVDRVSGQVSWRPARALPTVHLRGEAYTIEGALAANLPGDTVVVPLVQDGQGRGVLAELVLELDSTGTWVEVNWSRMVDEGEQRAILDGAEAWSRRGVSVRQRLASRDRVGATCHIVLAYDASELEQQPAAPPVARLALLERRRVSGGVALSF